MSEISKPRPRSLARECVFKAVFASRISDSHVREELDSILEEFAEKSVDKVFACALADHVYACQSQARDALQPYMRLQKSVALNDVEDALLLMAAVELLYHPDTPGKVVINESVNLCKRYGTADGFKLVNGVLDALLRQITGTTKEA